MNCDLLVCFDLLHIPKVKQKAEVDTMDVPWLSPHVPSIQVYSSSPRMGAVLDRFGQKRHGKYIRR